MLVCVAFWPCYRLAPVHWGIAQIYAKLLCYYQSINQSIVGVLIVLVWSPIFFRKQSPNGVWSAGRVHRHRPLLHLAVCIASVNHNTAKFSIKHLLAIGQLFWSSLKTVPVSPKILSGEEDVKSRRWLASAIMYYYVSVRRRPEHVPSNPATTVNDRGVDPMGMGPDAMKICRRGQSQRPPLKMSYSFIQNRLLCNCNNMFIHSFIHSRKFHSVKDEQLDTITSLILVTLTLPSLCLISSRQTVSSQSLSCTGLKVIVAQDKTPKRGRRLLRLPVVDNPHRSRLTCCPPHDWSFTARFAHQWGRVWGIKL